MMQSSGTLWSLTISSILSTALTAILALILWIIFGTSNYTQLYVGYLCTPSTGGSNVNRDNYVSVNVSAAVGAVITFSLFVGLYRTYYWDWYIRSLSFNTNISRWIDFSVTSAVMATVLDVVTGQTSMVCTLQRAAYSSAVCWAGYLVEYTGLGSKYATTILWWVGLASSASLVGTLLQGYDSGPNYAPTSSTALLYSIWVTSFLIWLYLGYWHCRERSKQPGMGGKVELVVYDLSSGLAAGFSHALMGERIPLIPHTSIRVYGCEVSLWRGLCTVPASDAPSVFSLPVMYTLDMGQTMRSQAEIIDWLNSPRVKDKYLKYELFATNCLAFCDDILYMLGCDSMPSYLSSIPSRVAQRLPVVAQAWDNYGLDGPSSFPPPMHPPLPSDKNPTDMARQDFIWYDIGFSLIVALYQIVTVALIAWMTLSSDGLLQQNSCGPNYHNLLNNTNSTSPGVICPPCITENCPACP